MKTIGFEQCAADACVLQLVQNGTVYGIAIVRLNDIFGVGRKRRCDRFCEDWNKLFPTNILGELCSYAGCHFSRNKINGYLPTSHSFYRQNRGEVWYCLKPDDSGCSWSGA